MDSVAVPLLRPFQGLSDGRYNTETRLAHAPKWHDNSAREGPHAVGMPCPSGVELTLNLDLDLPLPGEEHAVGAGVEGGLD